MVYHDYHSAPFTWPKPWNETVYLRLHGPEDGYRGSYDESSLLEYATYINQWSAEGKNIFIYFNNTLGGALSNLIDLNKLILSK